jgi:uncharacterized protein
MRVVIDTNVFISGIFWKGPPRKILLEWRINKFQMVLSADILNEYRRVVDEMSQKRGPIDVDDLFEVVGLNSILVQPVRFARPVCKDPDDDMFLEAAISGEAEYIVTGDKKLLELNGYGYIAVLTPGAFLKLI